MLQMHAFLVILICLFIVDLGFREIYKLTYLGNCGKHSILFLEFKVYFSLNLCHPAKVKDLQRLRCDYASNLISCEWMCPRLGAPSCSLIWLILRSK